MPVSCSTLHYFLLVSDIAICSCIVLFTTSLSLGSTRVRIGVPTMLQSVRGRVRYLSFLAIFICLFSMLHFYHMDR